MNKTFPQYHRILGIAPSTRGFGFAVLDGDKVVDWGVKTANGDKNKQCLLKLEEMISHYHPAVMVLEDYSAKGSRRSRRIRALGQQMIAMAKSHKVRVVLFSRQQVRKGFFAEGQGTKDALAEILSKRFPEELGFRLPRKRKPWMSEAYQMGIFDAVAVALVLRKRHSGDLLDRAAAEEA
jgi:Holliday junction resolvasome RuvABC endonuclease subunit